MLVATVLGAAGASSAADPYSFTERWRWVHFTTEDGLPSNRILDVCEAQDGTMWASTVSGLAWYDGYIWHAMGPESGLPRAACRRITADSNSGVLVVLDGKLYRGDRDMFEQVLIPDGGEGLNVLLAVPSVRGGLLLMSRNTQSRVAVYHRLADGRLTELNGPPGADPFAAEIPWGTSESEIWARTATQAYHLVGSTWHTHAKLGIGAEQAEAEAEANLGRSGFAWIKSPQPRRGLWTWHEGKRPKLSLRVEFGNLTTVATGPNGLVLAAEDSGLVHIRRGGTWSMLDPAPLHFEDVTAMRFRANGDLWIGTHRGLSLYRMTSQLWEHWRNPASDSTNRVNEILQARDGSVWIASSDGVEIRRPDGQIERLTQIESIDVRHTTGVAEDGAGNIWITSGWSYEGAFRFDGAAWTHFGAEQDLPGFRHKVRIDRKGRPWFLGLAADSRHDAKGGTGAAVLVGDHFEHWTTARGLMHDRVFAFAEGQNGELWFGTTGGLSCWHEGAWTHWTNSNGLRDARIWTLAVDEQNQVWFSGGWNGLGTIRDGEPHYLTTADGLPSDRWEDIRADPLGGIWATSAAAVMRIKDNHRYVISTAHGIGHSNLWPIFPTRDRVFIGTFGAGTTVLDRTMLENCALRVELAEPILHDESATIRWHAVARDRLISAGDIETRYRLQNGAWSKWSMMRFAHISAAPGTHDFTVQARNQLAESPPAEGQVSFTIPLPLFRQPTAIIPIVAGAVLIGSLIGWMAIRRRRHHAKLRESEACFQLLADEALRASEAEIRAIVNTAVDGIITIDEQGLVRSLNPAAEMLFGYSREEVIGHNVKMLMPPPYQERHDDYMNHYRTTGEKKIIGTGREVQGRRRDGSTFPLHLAIGEMHVGERRMFVGQVHDLTRRKAAEQALRRAHDELEARVVERTAELTQTNRILRAEKAALRENRARLAEAQRIARLGHWDYDVQTDKLVWSDEIYRIFGLEFQEFGATYDAFLEAVHPDDRQAVKEANDQALYHRAPYSVEHRVLRPDGTEVIVHERAEVTYDGQGRPTRMLGTAQDITERRHGEQERAKLKEQLHQSQKMEAIGQLAAGIAHDFNNLLMVMLGRCEQAKDMLPDQSPVLEPLAEAEKAALKARELTDSLLTFSRHIPAKKEPLNLCETVEQSCEMIRHTLPEGISLKLNTCTPPLWMTADSTRLHQLILNLAINARDAMPDGGTLSIEVAPASESDIGTLNSESKSTGAFARLTVRDTGHGMSPEIVSRALEPFYTTKPRGRGTGLGLSIVHGIVQEHGGQMDIRSEPGKGSEFTIVLPCSSADILLPILGAASSPIPSGEGRLVLLIAENSQERALVASMLQTQDYKVVKADNIDIGMERIVQFKEQPDLVIISSNGNPQESLDCLKSICQNCSRAGVIIIVDEDERHAQSFSQDAMILHKPFLMSDLARLASRVLQG
ncbi:MAG: PAS domain S-box protein [Planctomycetes bacterium]|nr:PAS domain S-box protein [Planctomycetota bacterium]